jgi:hypothetical protein
MSCHKQILIFAHFNTLKTEYDYYNRLYVSLSVAMPFFVMTSNNQHEGK